MTLCPHCQTLLPDPAPAQCPACFGILTTGDAPTRPAYEPPPLPPPSSTWPPPAFDSGGSPGEPKPPGGIPWDERDRIGLAQAFFETTKLVLTAPTWFYRRMPVTGGLAPPLLYAVIAGWIGLAAMAFYQAIWLSIVGPTALPFGIDRPEVSRAFAWLESWVGFGVQVGFGAVWAVIAAFVAAGILHLMLLLLGGAQRGFEATFRVVCFAQAPALLFVIPVFLIPFCGLLVAAWCLVLEVIGLAEAHRISHGRALAAVLLPLVACCCCCAGLVASFAGAMASLAGQLP